MTLPWTFQDAKEHFFIYIARTDGSDLLHELSGSPIVSHPAVDRVASTLYQNLTATAHATSAPYFTALLGAQGGRSSSIKKLIEVLAVSPDEKSLRAALEVINDSTAFIDQSFETLRSFYEQKIVPEAFQALLRQGTAMIWAAFETFCFEVFRLLFTGKLAYLQRVVAAQANGAPWSGKPKKLLLWIQSELQRDTSLTTQNAFDSFDELPSMTLRATEHFSKVLFPTDASLLSCIGAPELGKVSARRHLLMHAAGVVDQGYLDDSGEVLPLGSQLSVTPRELALGFRSISAASSALAQAAAGAL